MKRFCFLLALMMLTPFLSSSSLYAQNILRSLRTCELKAKPGDASGSYVDATGVLTYVPLPTARDPLDQHLQSYNIALCNRLDNGEISRAEFESLLNARIADIYQERQKLAMEAIKLDQERKRQQIENQKLTNERKSIRALRQATQTQRQANQSQREATQAQRQSTQAQRQSTQAQRQATQAQLEAIQAQREVTHALNNSTPTGTSLGFGTFSRNERSATKCSGQVRPPLMSGLPARIDMDCR